ncbi:response regulator [Pseudoalteromonas sp. MMG010]|uniref:hybrid sensor histidine kinase/response regulator n=1 Tax=Pseudoalteromonas sp. MMG010 TaxID=2822685 RepID=UPI001B39FE97|nr:hybrid sensor histidine kinase/response regulator [Pseudoalteromonas sp. MMG010]MBQ4831991.1 response regulator [Pseudoalteromonas sp. MMG010]
MSEKTSKLSVRLLWYITPLVILPLVFLGGFTLTNVTHSTEKQANLIMSRFVEQQQQKVFNYIDSFQAVTKLLAKSPVLNDFLKTTHSDIDNSTTNRLIALMDVFASYSEAYPDIMSINLISDNAVSHAYYSNKLNSAPGYYAFLDKAIHSPLNEQQFMLQKESGSTQLYFVKRIYSDDFYVTGAKEVAFLVLTINPSIINSSILESSYDNTLNLLMNEEGKILFSSQPKLRGQYLSVHEFSKIEALANFDSLSTIELSSIDKLERLVVTEKVSGHYYYVSTIPKDILYQSGKAISLITSFIVIISVIILPLLIFIVVRNLLLNPIEQLGVASKRAGDGDLSVRLTIEAQDEMGSLFNEFNYMIQQIKHYQEELEQYKYHLEEKVESRTQALKSMNKKLELAITQAEQANQLKSRFLANMSHEIRTPLTAIMGFTEQLFNHKENSSNKQHLSTILRNSKHLLELINNILDLSKIEAEKLVVESAKINVADLIHDIESIITPLANEKQLNFNIEYAFPLPHFIYNDVTRLKQILINIVSNAVKFTEQGTITLCVHYRIDSQQIEFVVIDTGIGMSRQQINQVFKPFTQADATTTRQFGGTGLGLSISKKLTLLLGGDINVRSELGAGSRFSITIACHLYDEHFTPVMINEISQLTPQIDPLLSFANQSFDAKILVAEDNPDNQLLIKLLLQTWGLEPDIVSNGAQAVEMALVNDYQLIIMDMQMPVMGGLEATELLRHSAYEGPIIALTANVMNHDIETYLNAGCNASLAKPIDKIALEKALVNYLKIEKHNQSKWDELLHSDNYKTINAGYVASLPDYIEQINELKHDKAALKSLAHNIKGSAGCFNFNEIYQCASKLEQALQNNINTPVNSLINDLIDALNNAIPINV